jgi:hypothetical protein
VAGAEVEPRDEGQSLVFIDVYKLKQEKRDTRTTSPPTESYNQNVLPKLKCQSTSSSISPPSTSRRLLHPPH